MSKKKQRKVLTIRYRAADRRPLEQRYLDKQKKKKEKNGENHNRRIDRFDKT